MIVVSMLIKPQPKPGTSQGAPRTSTGTRPAKGKGKGTESKKRWLFVPKAPRVEKKTLLFRRRGAESRELKNR